MKAHVLGWSGQEYFIMDGQTDGQSDGRTDGLLDFELSKFQFGQILGRTNVIF
jgi:hypothetical protein